MAKHIYGQLNKQDSLFANGVCCIHIDSCRFIKFEIVTFTKKHLFFSSCSHSTFNIWWSLPRYVSSFQMWIQLKRVFNSLKSIHFLRLLQICRQITSLFFPKVLSTMILHRPSAAAHVSFHTTVSQTKSSNFYHLIYAITPTQTHLWKFVNCKGLVFFFSVSEIKPAGYSEPRKIK